MKTYSAIISTDAWDDFTPAIIEFEINVGETNNLAADLIRATKIEFARTTYLTIAGFDKENAKDEEWLLNELEADAFEVHIIAIFEGKTLLPAKGVKF